MSSSVRSQAFSCGFLGLGVLVLLLGMCLGAEPAAQPKEIKDSIDMQMVGNGTPALAAILSKEIIARNMKLVPIPPGKFMTGLPNNLDSGENRVSQGRVIPLWKSGKCAG